MRGAMETQHAGTITNDAGSEREASFGYAEVVILSSKEGWNRKLETAHLHRDLISMQHGAFWKSSDVRYIIR